MLGFVGLVWFWGSRSKAASEPRLLTSCTRRGRVRQECCCGGDDFVLCIHPSVPFGHAESEPCDTWYGAACPLWGPCRLCQVARARSGNAPVYCTSSVANGADPGHAEQPPFPPANVRIARKRRQRRSAAANGTQISKKKKEENE